MTASPSQTQLRRLTSAIAAALRARPALCEFATLAGLAGLTVHATRGSVWLAFFVATPAAVGLGRGTVSRARLALPALVVMAGLAVLGVVRGPHGAGAGHTLLARALAAAAGTPILAEAELGEQVALAGGRVWISNPIDAFRRRDQRVYLDWLQGKPTGDTALLHAPRAVLVRPGSAAQLRLVRRTVFREAARDAGAVLYVRSTRHG